MRVSTLLLVLACSGVGGAVAADTQSQPLLPAVWKHQKLDFHYFGRTSRYSCDGMRDKVRALLLEVGVRKDLRLLTYGCEIGRIELKGMNPGLSIEFSSPVPQIPNGAGGVEPFEAHYVTFDFHQDAFRNLNVGDCELVEEFAKQILPLLSTRNLKQDITCVPYQQSGGSYRVSGEVLKAVPAPDATQRTTP